MFPKLLLEAKIPPDKCFWFKTNICPNWVSAIEVKRLL